METDNELVADSEGRRAEVAAWPHDLFEDGLFLHLFRTEIDDLFPLGDAEALRPFDQSPGLLFCDLVFACIDCFINADLFLLKKLLSFVAGRSAFTQVCPFNIHPVISLAC
ncbi:MAG: hypothetical protein C0622_02765 [Desulfuromonas sp.]|nr:MAG: hypothetical protein C0622_02765 [Desulfuromonas sp.]